MSRFRLLSCRQFLSACWDRRATNSLQRWLYFRRRQFPSVAGRTQIWAPASTKQLNFLRWSVTNSRRTADPWVITLAVVKPKTHRFPKTSSASDTDEPVQRVNRRLWLTVKDSRTAFDSWDDNNEQRLGSGAYADRKTLTPFPLSGNSFSLWRSLVEKTGPTRRLTNVGKRQTVPLGSVGLPIARNAVQHTRSFCLSQKWKDRIRFWCI